MVHGARGCTATTGGGGTYTGGGGGGLTTTGGGATTTGVGAGTSTGADTGVGTAIGTGAAIGAGSAIVPINQIPTISISRIMITAAIIKNFIVDPIFTARKNTCKIAHLCKHTL